MTRPNIITCLVVFAITLWPILNVADEVNDEGFGLPTLLVISHPKASDIEEGRRVRARVSIVRPNKPVQAQTSWRILPGTLYPLNKHPKGEAKVKLYTGEGVHRQLVCSVKVKYYRNRQNKWQPFYKLDPDTIIIWRGSAWEPLNPVADEYNSTFLTNKRMPNGQGYYPYLDLESVKGPLAINSWIVGKGLH